MRDSHLARVAWQMGQVLLPEHILALEESVLAEGRIRQRALAGAPMVGLNRLYLHEDLLARGILSLEGLLAIFPSGELVSLPGNVQVEPLDLTGLGISEAKVRLHLMEDDAGAGIVGDDGVARRSLAVKLSPNRVERGARAYLELGRFVRDTGTRWQLDPAVIPPLSSVRGTPFTAPLLERLELLVTEYARKLDLDRQSIYATGQSYAMVVSVLRETLSLKGLLQDLRAQVDVHPYTLYQAARRFFIEAHLYQGGQDSERAEIGLAPYDHDDLGGCLGRLVGAVASTLRVDHVHPGQLPFTKEGGTLVISELPAEVYDGSEVWLLIKKPRVGMSFDVDKIKLGARSRLQRLHRLALTGVPLTPVTSPFPQLFGAEVEFYQIRQSDEWRYALNEGSLAFHLPDELTEIGARLCWRVS